MITEGGFAPTLWAGLGARCPLPVPRGYRRPCRAQRGVRGRPMGEVYRRHPDDVDIAALYADALLNLTPWQLWDRWTGEPAEGSRALEARRVLERALALPGGSGHPGLIHFYIHLMEMSAEPQTALPVADRLRTLVPDAGHLGHMATHLDVLCGDHSRTVEWNRRAAEVDRKYVESAGPINFAALYRAHNLHFVAYGAMFFGQQPGRAASLRPA